MKKLFRKVYKSIIGINKDSGIDMNINQKAEYIGGVIKRIDNFNMASFEDRLIFQKTIYLLQAFGIYAGINDFSWYLHGPYSSELTKVGFAIKGIYSNLFPTMFVDENIEKRFMEFSDYISNKKTNSEYLELLVSIHWLKEINPHKDKDALLQFLNEKKPQLNLKEYENAWNDLIKYNLI